MPSKNNIYIYIYIYRCWESLLGKKFEILSQENTPMIGTQDIQLESFKFESWGCKSEVYEMKESYHPWSSSGLIGFHMYLKKK